MAIKVARKYVMILTTEDEKTEYLNVAGKRGFKGLAPWFRHLAYRDIKTLQREEKDESSPTRPSDESTTRDADKEGNSEVL